MSKNREVFLHYFLLPYILKICRNLPEKRPNILEIILQIIADELVGRYNPPYR